MPTFDYTSMGFITFDCLVRPVTAIPPGGETYFVDELTLAVSGAAGSAAIVAAKHGLRVQAVGGVGRDDMGDWVLAKLGSFGVDCTRIQVCDGVSTSSSVVTTRPDGARPALHKRGATGNFFVDVNATDRVLDTAILHVGGVGLMDAMDRGRTAEVMAEAKARGCITTLDVFASTAADLAKIEPLLMHTDYFMPSEEEAMALSGRCDLNDIAAFLLDYGVGAVILTLGPNGAMYRDSAGTAYDVPAYEVDVVCTCGCGDCFNGGFATGLHLGYDILDCLRLAQASSAQNATGLGSQAGIVDLETTNHFVASSPVRAVRHSLSGSGGTIVDRCNILT